MLISGAALPAPSVPPLPSLAKTQFQRLAFYQRKIATGG
jgi:hypothetical protein